MGQVSAAQVTKQYLYSACPHWEQMGWDKDIKAVASVEKALQL
jgi:hypothetical protein